jgi:hypothetical protein
VNPEIQELIVKIMHDLEVIITKVIVALGIIIILYLVAKEFRTY